MNLRPAPFALTPRLVAQLIGDDTSGTGTVPVLPLRLADRPRRSEAPRLARANDNKLLPPPGEKIRSGEDGARGAVSGNLPVHEAAPHPDWNDGGARG